MDREKVVKGLNDIGGFIAGRIGIEQARNFLRTIDEAIAILKEQEAKNVVWSLNRAHCPTCGELFPKKKDVQYIRFCSYCGQAVKWK